MVNYNLLCHLFSDKYVDLELIEAAGRPGRLESGFSAFPTNSGCLNSVLPHSDWNHSSIYIVYVAVMLD